MLKLFRCLKQDETQLTYYDPGVGTLSRSDAWSRFKLNAKMVFGLATGWGLDDNILQAYRFLIDNYENGSRTNALRNVLNSVSAAVPTPSARWLVSSISSVSCGATSSTWLTMRWSPTSRRVKGTT